MKKAFCIILLVVLLLSLTACGNQTGMLTALKDGVWTRKSVILGTVFIKTYDFGNDGHVDMASTTGGKTSYTSATYEVQADKIVLTYDDGEIMNIEYTYENGNLELFLVSDSGDIIAELVNE